MYLNTSQHVWKWEHDFYWETVLQWPFEPNQPLDDEYENE